MIYWGIGLLCQFIVTASYMVAHANELLAAYESEAKLQAFMEEAFRFIFRFSTETTAVGALIMLPICIYMMRKDKRMRAFSGIKENVWKGPAKIYPLTVGFGVTAGIVVNNLLILSNIRAISQSYQTTSEALYSAPLATQLICLGIIVPVLEECLYRGVIYRRVRDMSSWKKAAVISSLILDSSTPIWYRQSMDLCLDLRCAGCMKSRRHLRPCTVALYSKYSVRDHDCDRRISLDL